MTQHLARSQHVALGSPNSLQKRGVMTKSPSGALLRGVSTVRYTLRSTLLSQPYPRSLGTHPRGLPASPSCLTVHLPSLWLCRVSLWHQWHLLNSVSPSFNSVGSVTTSITSHNLSSFFTGHALPISLNKGWWLACNFWPLSFFCIGQFLNSPIFATGAGKCL